MGSSSSFITITFGAGGNTDPRDVVLTVKNWCTDAVIQGAAVTLTVDGTPDTKTTDAEGKVTFTLVPPGTHPLTITAAGYLDSATDTLANDSIQV